MLEARNDIATIFNIPREQLTICVNAISPMEHLPFMGSFETRADFVFLGRQCLGALVFAIEKANFDENLTTFINIGAVFNYEVRVFVELAPRKVKK